MTSAKAAAVSLRAHARVVTASWHGNASDAADASLTRLGSRMSIGGEVAFAAHPVLIAYAAELRAAQAEYAAGQALVAAGQADALVAAGEQRELSASAAPWNPEVNRAASAAQARVAGGQAAMSAALARAETANAAAATQMNALTGELAEMTFLPPAPPPPPPPADDGWSFSDIGHVVLDGVGLVPVVGEVADGANAVWYLAEGDEVNAGISAAAMIPLAGTAAVAANPGLSWGGSCWGTEKCP